MQRTLRTEALVIGAGPAGSVAALNLAPFRDVTIVEQGALPILRPGESLVPAFRRLITDMGLFESFQALAFPAYHGNDSVWGNEAIWHTSFVEDPDGHGWHIDRQRFETWLRDIVQTRGARLISSARACAAERKNSAFTVQLRTKREEISITADVVIDASGRQSAFARSQGASRKRDFPLVCRAVYGRSAHRSYGAGISFIEAVEHGWWYTAPLFGEGRILAFHTDADLAAARQVRTASQLLDEAQSTIHLKEILAAERFVPQGACSGHAAEGSTLDTFSGPGWLAAGDAALTLEPLASRGILNAVFMGLASAEAAHSWLGGDRSACINYADLISGIRSAYCHQLYEAYSAERRWLNSVFWQRRQEKLVYP